MTTTAQVLRDAKALIADPDHWIKGQWEVRDENGRLCYCALGAVRYMGFGRGFKPAVDALTEAIGQPVARFNDLNATTHADVMAAFDRAIAAEESA